MKIIHRKDNTFVIEKNGFPFHLTEDYEEYSEILEKYENNGKDFEEENSSTSSQSFQNSFRRCEGQSDVAIS